MKSGQILLISLLALCALSFAVEPLRFISPVQKEVLTGDEIEVGTIGPGQTFTVQLDPKVYTGGINGIGGRWDQAIAFSLPDGWSSRPSKLYQNPLSVEITASPTATDGDYRVKLKLIDEANAEQIGDEIYAVLIIHVKKDVLSMKVEPTSAEVGAGQPARFAITITNDGAANEIFDISSSGVSGWAFRKNVYVPAHSSKTITYEVVGEEEASYRATITSQASSSSLIRSELPIALTVRTNLISDYKATSNGVLLFPFVLSPAYSLAGLISLFLG